MQTSGGNPGEETVDGCQFWSLHFPAHLVGGDMEAALVPHDPFFFFHHNGLDRVRREWQSRNEQLRSSAFGYPVQQGAFTERAGRRSACTTASAARSTTPASPARCCSAPPTPS